MQKLVKNQDETLTEWPGFYDGADKSYSYLAAGYMGIKNDLMVTPRDCYAAMSDYDLTVADNLIGFVRGRDSLRCAEARLVDYVEAHQLVVSMRGRAAFDELQERQNVCAIKRAIDEGVL